MCNLGDRVKKIRLDNSLTQIEFGKMVCLSQPHLSSIENNKERPSKSVIKLISVLFHVDESWIVNG